MASAQEVFAKFETDLCHLPPEFRNAAQEIDGQSDDLVAVYIEGSLVSCNFDADGEYDVIDIHNPRRIWEEIPPTLVIVERANPFTMQLDGDRVSELVLGRAGIQLTARHSESYPSRSGLKGMKATQAPTIAIVAKHKTDPADEILSTFQFPSPENRTQSTLEIGTGNITLLSLKYQLAGTSATQFSDIAWALDRIEGARELVREGFGVDFDPEIQGELNAMNLAWERSAEKIKTRYGITVR